jgi:hypothetical protein
MRGLALGSWRERRAMLVLLDWRTTPIMIQISNDTVFRFELDMCALKLQDSGCFFFAVSQYELVEALSLALTMPLLGGERS